MSDFYTASDYASVCGGKTSFYFGYEETLGDEWCFVAKVDGKETIRIPQSKLGVGGGSDMSDFLLAGISLWLENFE